MGNQKQNICYALEYKGDKTIKVKAIAYGDGGTGTSSL